MSIWWYIIIDVLIVVNILAFISAIGVSYDEWKKKGRKDWQTPLMGLFFLPLCFVIAIGLPLAKLRDYRQEKKRKKQWEESKKYHFHKFAFRLKDLPFEPISNEIIYVENAYNERFNQLVNCNLEYIQDCLDKSKYFKSRFVYLPFITKAISEDLQAISYWTPYKINNGVSSSHSLTSSSLLDYMANPENKGKITPCFARYRGSNSGYSIFECIRFNPEEDVDEKKFFKALCSAFDHFPLPVGPAYQTATKNKEDKLKLNADERFEETSKKLIKEIEEKIGQLRKMGVSQWVLEQLVRPQEELSKLVITRDFKLFLPDYNNMEIKMEPLVKAIYLLFLRHPEGILFKYLPDYREELTQIYVKLKPLGMSDRVLQSIEDVTNPLLNSINEKCARIRGAFVGQFDDHLARHYYIDGLRGEVKKIALPRDLVVWE